MFLNFALDIKIRPYAGTDLSYFPTLTNTVHWEHWERCLMGFKPSLYNAIRAFGWCEDFICGNARALNNPLHWVTVCVNLPRDEDNDPLLPWVTKTVLTQRCEQIAGDFYTYVDDIRTCGQSEDHCWQVM
jgi:hypothetical protein